MHLPKTMDMNEPQKPVVTTTTIKGRCDLPQNYFQATAFLNTNGATNVALIHPPKFGDSLINLSYLKDCREPLQIPIHLENPQLRYLKYGEFKNDINAVPESVKNIFSSFSPNTQDTSEYYGMSYDDILDNAQDTFDRIESIITFWYADNYILTLGNSSLKNKYETEKNYELNLKTYAKLLDKTQQKTVKHLKKIKEKNKKDPIYLGKNNTHPLCVMFSKALNEDYMKACTKVDIFKKHPPQIVLWTAFGDLRGATNEDGVILDEKIREYGPKRLVSATLNIKFMEATKIIRKNQTIKKSSSIFYQPMNSKTNNILSIGTLKSSEPLIITKSKNITVEEVKIGIEYHYYVTLEDTNQYKKTIESYYLESNSSLYFNIRYMCPLDDGTKFLNMHGQKCIASVADLVENCEPAYKRDGTIVKPQIIFSTTSLVGRTVASQVYGMACSESVAFTKDGAMVAPMGFNIHNIEASSKCKKTLVKNDLMTAENGFNSNLLSFTSSVLKNQGPSRRHKNPLHFVQQLHSLSGVILQPLDFDQDTIMDIDDQDIQMEESEQTEDEEELELESEEQTEEEFEELE